MTIDNSANQPAIQLGDLHLMLTSGAGEVNILRGFDLNVEQGETLGIVGPSGSGKTSLLMIIAGLETATSGEVQISGRDILTMDEDALALFRRDHVGIVFQDFHLVPTMTALENVAMPLEFAGVEDAFQRAEEELAAALQKIGEKDADELKTVLSDAIEGEMHKSGVSVERDGSNVVIRFPSSIAFPSGSNSLNIDFTDLIEKLAPILKETPGDIIVSGHTDNIPLHGGAFESNWDLSAARATSVIHNLLFDHGMDPQRMTVQGFGDSRPIQSNETVEGRAANRRVEITILSPDVMAELNKAAEEAGAEVSKGFYDDE